MSTQDYVQILRSEFQKKQQADPHFSLRDFARFLKIAPSTLSQTLSGKRKLGLKAAMSIIEACELTEDLSSKFLSSIMGTSIKTPIADWKDANFRMLEPEEFARISTWMHYAVLSLGLLPNALFAPNFVAERLNISIEDAERVMRDLLDLNFIIVEKGRFRQSTRLLRTRSDVPSDIIRDFHAQVLGKATQALEEVEVSDRDMSTITMAISKKKIRAAKKKIKDFRRGLMEFLSDGPKDEVYALQISLFPLTRKR